MSDPISQKYQKLGGLNGFLGKPLNSEQICQDGVGHYCEFIGGSIHWHTSSGAYEVHGSIREKWITLGRERSYLGYPRSDEQGTVDGKGRISYFQKGVITWMPDVSVKDNPERNFDNTTLTNFVGSNKDGRLEVFAKGTDNAIWHTWQTSPGGSWYNWTSLGGTK